MSPLWANVFGALLFVVSIILFAVPHILIWSGLWITASFRGLAGFTIALLIGLVAHEFVHALGWRFFGKVPLGQIEFGFHPRWLMPYAHCRVPLPISAYRAGALLPSIVTGLLPGLAGIATGTAWLTVVGAILFSAAAGDLLVLWDLRWVPPGAQIQDHPSKIGGQVFLSSYS